MKITLAQPIELDVAAADEAPRRTLTGIAVPYGVDANASTGPVRFLAGSLPTDGPAPKLIRDHDLSQPIGIVTARVSTDEAMLFEARISETSAGDEALVLASDGVLDAVSVGVEVEKFHYESGVLVVESGRWRELSLVPFGAFDAARVLDVAASDDVDPAPAPEPTPEPTEPSEEDTMTESAPVEAAEAPAQIQTAPIVVAEQPKRSVGSIVNAALRGQLPKVAAATSDTSDVPGVIPNPLVGEVFTTLTGARPIFSALGPRAMPAGDPFYARKVTQHSSVGVQAAEHDALSSQAYQVSKVTVDKVTLGGYVDLSEQEILYSDDNVVQLVVEDMANIYAEETEKWLGQTILHANAGTATATVSDWTDGDEVITDLYAAAAEIYSGFGRMPTHLLLHPDIWADVGAAKDSAGNRIFPYLGPSNAAGTLNGATSMTGNPLGLALIVSDKFTPVAGAKAMMLSATCLTIFEDLRGALRVEQPATLSTRLAFRGYVAAADYDIANGCLIL